MPESWGFPLFVAALLIFLGWFAVGTQWNVRKGNDLLKWLQQGLPLVGERTTVRWLGSSVVELKVAKAKDPFRTAETLIVLEPRDVSFLWALARLRGRRDTLIFRTQLRAAPPFEIQVFDPKGWTRSVDERTLQSRHWSPVELPAGSPLRAYASGGSPARAKPLIDQVSRVGGRLVRLSVRRDVPNLEVHWLLPDKPSLPARDLFLKLRQVGEDLTRA